MARLTDARRQEFTASYPEWTLDEESISRTFEFPDFVGSLGFVVRVAVLAEKSNHHPDIDIRWNRVTLRLSTHDEGGVTEKDTELATAIDALV